jgi:hypothetical protein
MPPSSPAHCSRGPCLNVSSSESHEHTQHKRAGCCGVSFTRLCCERTNELSRRWPVEWTPGIRDAKRCLFPLGTFRQVMSCQGENQIAIYIYIYIIIYNNNNNNSNNSNTTTTTTTTTTTHRHQHRAFQIQTQPVYSRWPKTDLRHWASLAGSRRSNQDLRSRENASVAVKQATKE